MEVEQHTAFLEAVGQPIFRLTFWRLARLPADVSHKVAVVVMNGDRNAPPHDAPAAIAKAKVLYVVVREPTLPQVWVGGIKLEGERQWAKALRLRTTV